MGNKDGSAFRADVYVSRQDFLLFLHENMSWTLNEALLTSTHNIYFLGEKQNY